MKRNLSWLTILGAIISGLLNSGCLVVSSHHLSKPVGPSEMVEFHHPPQGDLWGWYVRHAHSPEMDFDITVYNNTERMQVGFLFWVLPVPYSESGSPDAEIQADIRPIASNVTFDPWRIAFIPTNGIPVAPVKIKHLENGTWKTVAHEPLSIHKPESFRLEYNAPCNPDAPFTLSIHGITAPDESNVTTSIAFQRARIVRTDFRLPY